MLFNPNPNWIKHLLVFLIKWYQGCSRLFIILTYLMCLCQFSCLCTSLLISCFLEKVVSLCIWLDVSFCIFNISSDSSVASWILSFFVNYTFSAESFKLSSIHDLDFLNGWWIMDILGGVLEGFCTPFGKWGMFSTSPGNSFPKQGMP